MNNNKKIVILGANGQVASEIILKLKEQNPNLDIVAVCRNKVGSLFLRYNGVSVIHASIERKDFPEELLKGVDIIINTIYIHGKPSEIKKRHENILRKIFKLSDGNTKIVHFSTVAVFKNNIYGEEKLHQENLIKKLSKAKNQEVVILRLGHVLGPNQGLSNYCINLAKSRDNIFLPNKGENDCNCVSIQYLSEVILDLLKKDIKVKKIKIYLTVFNPKVTWKEIFSLLSDNRINFKNIFSCNKRSKNLVNNLLNSIFYQIRNNEYFHRISLKIIRHLPIFVEEKIYARHLLSRSQKQINELIISQYKTQPDNLFLVSAPGDRYPISRSIKKGEILP